VKWFPIHPDFVYHRKTTLLADRLKITRTTAVGILVRLWAWAVRNAPDGVMTLSPAELQNIVGADFDTTVFAALIEAGWLDRAPQGLRLHEWEQYGGGAVSAIEKASAKRTDRRMRATSSQDGRNEKRRAWYARKKSKIIKLGERRPEKPPGT
jgi:hypothetical protein